MAQPSSSASLDVVPPIIRQGAKQRFVFDIEVIIDPVGLRVLSPERPLANVESTRFEDAVIEELPTDVGQRIIDAKRREKQDAETDKRKRIRTELIRYTIRHMAVGVAKPANGVDADKHVAISGCTEDDVKMALAQLENPTSSNSIVFIESTQNTHCTAAEISSVLHAELELRAVRFPFKTAIDTDTRQEAYSDAKLKVMRSRLGLSGPMQVCSVRHGSLPAPVPMGSLAPASAPSVRGASAAPAPTKEAVACALNGAAVNEAKDEKVQQVIAMIDEAVCLREENKPPRQPVGLQKQHKQLGSHVSLCIHDEIERLRTQQSQSEADIRALDAEINEMESKIKALSAALAESEAKRARTDKDIVEVNELYASQADQNTDMKRNLDDHSGLIYRARGETKKLDRDVRSRFHEVERCHRELVDATGERCTKIERKQIQCGELYGEVATQSKENADRITRIEERCRRIEEIGEALKLFLTGIQDGQANATATPSARSASPPPRPRHSAPMPSTSARERGREREREHDRDRESMYKASTNHRDYPAGSYRGSNGDYRDSKRPRYDSGGYY